MKNEMEEWAYFAMDAIHQQSQKDEHYRQMKEQWMSLAEEYEAFVQSLPKKQQELLTEYQCCVDNLHFQQIRVAYFLGKKHPGQFQK